MRIEIPKKDIRVDYYKGSGPGGQNRNKRETAVRITHVPTGVKAECCEERTRGQNYEIARSRFVDALKKHYEDPIQKARAARYAEKPDASFGAQIRSYRLVGDPVVVDHRTGVTGTPSDVLNGNIDIFLVKPNA